MRRLILALSVGLLLAAPWGVYAQELTVDVETFERARVTAVSPSVVEVVPGTDTTAHVQDITAEILTGAQKGSVVTFRNDFTQLAPGDEFFVRHTVNELEGHDFYSVADPYRLTVLGGLLLVFLVLTVLIGGAQGVRGLVALGGGVLLIVYVLVPGIALGYSPVLVAVVVASLIIVVGSYVTHGVNRTTTSAVLGMVGTVLVTGFLAWLAVHAAHLSGYSSEEVTYLHFQYGGTIDLVGLLMSGIVIGLLGVLYDGAIGQAVAVEELMRLGATETRAHIFSRAMRIGREHIGALVNTLAIAYVGAALPLMLLIGKASAPLAYIINSEILATEIIRILVGSIGLILAVPITTLITVYVLSVYGLPERKHGHIRHTH